MKKMYTLQFALNKWLLYCLLFSVTACTQKQQKEEAQTTAATPPNIIYILADDMGYGELGCYGQSKIETPNIDKLAANGMKFTQHYSGAPVCAPARGVLLTGLHAGHAHIRGNDEWAERGDVWDFAKAVEDPNLEGQRPIPADTPTIGKLLQQSGYKTGVVGKWGLGAPLTDGIPNQRGFDFFFGYNCQRQAHTYYPKHLWKNQEKVLLDNELVVPNAKLAKDADPYDSASYAKYNLTDYAPELMQKEVLNFIEANKEQPFFMYYATPIPHAPIQAPKRWVDYYVKKFGEEEPYLGNRGYFPHRNPKAGYAAMISYLDEQVGEIVAKLKELGLYENTLIVFTSDNGPTYNGGTESPWFNSGGPFKSEYGWGKGFLKEGGIRVPMIASWPGHIKAGTQTDHASAFYDILPTFCEITGTQAPDNTDGISFLPTLLGQKQTKSHDFLYWEFPAYGGQQAVRMGNWKGIRKNILDKKKEMEFELFDLSADIQEVNNLADQHPEIVEKILKIMEREHTPASIERFKMPALGDELAAKAE
ncbi:arylsulfatase [Rapidithrix thailandica]|uniref:Arylsulfatase n=1 Tax=Rapidithrix thailandica TaxID=413964 RepID=A0AAW9SIE0_9BACT